MVYFAVSAATETYFEGKLFMNTTYESLLELARDFWEWRACYQPVCSDDLARLERPSGWTPSWSQASVEAQRAQLAAFETRWKEIDSAAWPVSQQVDYRLIGSALARDRVRTTVSGFTQLGLVEMTRKRTRESLAHMLCEPYAVCQGRGEVKTARTVCYEILREVLREARAFPAKELRVLASQTVCDLFLEEESGALAMLTDFIGRPVSMQVESSYTQEQYDIVLM